MLTHDELIRLLSYNRHTGIFTWNVNEGKKRIGKVAGNLNKHTGYVQIRINKILYYAHILAWFYETKIWPINQIDHKNNIRHENFFDNLQEITEANNKKKLGMKSNNKSGFKGVYFCNTRKKYTSKITNNNKEYHIGYFDCPKLAAEAYDMYAKHLHGDFAKTNKSMGLL